MNDYEAAIHAGHLHQSQHGHQHPHPLVQQQHNSNGAHVARSKHLTVATSEDPLRSLSPSPAPGQGLSDVDSNSYMADPPSSGEGDGIDSHFGRAPKSAKSSASSAKRKAAPRTSRACLACRRQKMRCEGADNPPCKRCVANEVDCMFERRSDYLLNPEDRAWQNGVEKRLEHLSRAVDQILAHLQTGGPLMTGGFMGAPGGPHTAASFPGADMGHPGGPPGGPGYYEHVAFDHRPPPTAGGMQLMPPNTAPLGGQGDPMEGMGRVNYLIPGPGETAAIAAARAGQGHPHTPGMPLLAGSLKRGRGSTLPGGLPSAGFGTPGHPDSSTFALFSPRTGGLDTAFHSSSSSGGLGQPPYAAYTPGPPPGTAGGPAGSNPTFEVQHSYPSHGGHGHGHHEQHDDRSREESVATGRGESAVPRSMHSPVVRFAPTPVQQQQARADPSPLGGASHRAGEEEVAA